MYTVKCTTFVLCSKFTRTKSGGGQTEFKEKILQVIFHTLHSFSNGLLKSSGSQPLGLKGNHVCSGFSEEVKTPATLVV